MGAGLSGRSRRLGVLAGGVLLAVTGLSLVASSSHALARTTPKPGSSCAHPVYSSQTLGGPAGDIKDFRVRFKTVSNPEPGTPTPETEQVEVAVTNPRIIICSAIVTDLGYNHATGRYEHARRHVYHLSIGPHGGLSSSITVPANAHVVAQVFARIEPAKLVTKPTSGCTLDTIWDGVGDGGDKQDYTVMLKTTGHEPGPYSVQVEVKILNPKVEICSATVLWYEGNGATGQHSAPVTIGVHGGVSSRVPLPASADGVAAKVLGRLT